MSKVDTSAATVEAIAKRLKRDIDWRPGSLCEQAATALRALLVERDAALAEAARLRDIVAVLLSVMPVFPAAARQIVGMEDRYEAALKEARAASPLGGPGHE